MDIRISNRIKISEMLKENIFQSELISIAYAKIRKMVNLKDHHTWIQKRSTITMHTFSEMEPPLTWTSMICAFFWRRRRIFCWVWQIARTTEQYFLIWFKSFSISFLPKSSFHFNWAFEKAFFLDLDLIYRIISTQKF